MPPRVFFLPVLLVLAGCGSGDTYDEAPSHPAAIEAVLSLRWDTATVAFEAMTAGRFEEDQALDVWRAGDDHAFLRTARVHDAGVVVSATALDSSGSFRSSWTERLIAPSPGLSIPFDHWLDGEPVYESPRRRDDYRFEVLADTTITGIPVRRYRVTAREPGRGALQTVRFLVNGSDNQVVGLEEKREERAPFFKQDSALRVLLKRSDSGWVPDLVVLDVMIDAPARDARRYRVSRKYVEENDE